MIAVMDPYVGERLDHDALDSSSPSSLDHLLSSSGLLVDHASSTLHLLVDHNSCCRVGASGGEGTTCNSTAAVLTIGEGCAGNIGSSSGGNICGGSGGGGGGGGADGCAGFDFSDSENTIDAYYQSMIQADPGNSLILANYAKFLKEVEGNLNKAEEYCERAIVANQGDGGVLSMYADIIWEKSKDAKRAETYFDRAVAATTDDCYIMASYARYLWDAEEEEDEDIVSGVVDGLQRIQGSAAEVNRKPSHFVPGTAPSIAAAS